MEYNIRFLSFINEPGKPIIPWIGPLKGIKELYNYQIALIYEEGVSAFEYIKVTNLTIIIND